jgi:hypothetical protein
MPTGYTTDIYNGKDVSFRDFALNCARAFGACIMQRDDPADEKPKIMPEESYHTEELKKLGKFKKPTKAEFDSYVIERIADCKETIDKMKKLQTAYNKKIEEAQNWNPPTPEHEGLKKFMIQQLTESMLFDCSYDHYESELKKLNKMTYDDYFEQQKQYHKWKIKYHIEYLEKDLNNIRKRNKWIQDLYNSL